MKQNLYLFLAIVSVIGMVMMSGCNRPETYTVTFNSNGGSGTMAAQTFTEDEAQTLTLNAFTYEGHTFASWNTIQDGSGISYTDGQTITATADMTLYAQWKIVPECVDLGLPSGTKWATFNVGATSPEEYGDYFAWGETVPKNYYSWGTYKYSNNGNDDNSRLTKYCSASSYGNNGFTDTLTTLEASDDAATVNWGSAWRMPTREEFNELKTNCTVTRTTHNGVNGHLFTGPNGNSIFLPSAGIRHNDVTSAIGSECYYWSSSLRTDFTDDASFFDSYGIGISKRYDGLSVRAVCQLQN